ncbi:related to heterokaryon incompatibility protein (het-6OR allele) [Claviceps purpurea 20.1]|uniref:Related to heterokaryon incompatibility protein (Het-6OR allele) n=1 Tax=Claviceps purpurea (strain 20.1) TaxID=1111077 RepID=M1WG59_CLAP2|nr:related to heterokaryon incompatibility protein (het-6OR allele) [Claviceps purpurea 20.1]
MLPYQYRPLQKGEIRLLRLDAINGSDQLLSGSIIHHKLVNPIYRHPKDTEAAFLDHPLPYEALSYHWGGDNRALCEVLIHDDDGNDSVLKVTKTLHSILCRLVSQDQQLVIWADAICINQINSSTNLEKGEQIQLMPDIYRTAARVQVYLGDESADLPAAVQLLSTIADYSEHLDDFAHAEGEIGLDLALQNGFILPPPDDERWPALRAFFCRPWFRRVWVIQEFVYATEVRVMCGDLEIDWHRLWLASKAYVSNRNLIYQGYGKDMLSFFSPRVNVHREAHEGAIALHRITDLRLRAMGYMSGPYMVYNIGDGEPANMTGLSIRKNLDAIKGFEKFARSSLLSDRSQGKTFPYGRSTLLDLLHNTSNFQATKPIDRLYALLGLADDADGYKPIYSVEETTAVVSTRFAAAFIENGHLQRVLASAGIRSNTSSPGEAPSWVPDWTKVQYAQDKLIGFTLISAIGDALEQRDTQRREQTAATETNDAPESGDASASAGLPDAGSNYPPAEQEDLAAQEVKTEATPKLYNASASTDPVFSGNVFRGQLTIRATLLGQIMLVLPGKLMLPCLQYENMILKMGHQYVTGEPMVEALWRTLIGNRTMHGELAPPEFAAQYEAMKAHDQVLITKAFIVIVIAIFAATPIVVLAIRLLPVLAHVGIVTVLLWMQYLYLKPALSFLVLLPVFRWLYIWALVPTLLTLLWFLLTHWYATEMLDSFAKMGCSTALTTSTLPADCAAYASSLATTVNRHALCVTREHMMGLVPLLARGGDMIVVMHGCDVPYVIRRTKEQGYYQLVGEAYVHGVMNGEAMQQGAEIYSDITLV